MTAASSAVRPSSLVVLLVPWTDSLVLDGDGGGHGDYSGLLFKIEKLTGLVRCMRPSAALSLQYLFAVFESFVFARGGVGPTPVSLLPYVGSSTCICTLCKVSFLKMFSRLQEKCRWWQSLGTPIVNVVWTLCYLVCYKK